MSTLICSDNAPNRKKRKSTQHNHLAEKDLDAKKSNHRHPEQKWASPDEEQRVQKPIQARLSKQAHMTGARESTT